MISPYFLNVWTEPWIPSLPEFKVSSIPPEDYPIMCVADLVDVQHMQLDQTTLRECFTQAKCLKILKIPLSFDQRDPKLIWHFSRSGSPSVKAVYYNLKKVEDANQSRSHPSSSCGLLPGYWKSIWSISIPHKIHVFLWRVSTNALATNLNLFQIRCMDSPICQVYQMQEESIEYMLSLYNFAKAS